MKPCKPYQKLLRKLIAGEISPEEKKSLQEHARECPDCASFLETERRVSDARDAMIMPDDQTFGEMRRQVMQQIHRQSRTGNVLSISDRFDERVAGFSWSYALAAVLVFFSGFMTHLLLSVSGTPRQAEAALVDHIEQTAAYHTSLDQMQQSPYRFTDLQVQALSDDRLMLSFSVSRHLSMVRSKNDPIISEILAQAIINQNRTADRINIINQTASQMDPRIKQALLVAINSDPAAAVRLRALERLQFFPMDDEIQQTLLKVVETDDSASMRLNAISYLTGQRIDKELISATLESQEKGKFSAIRHKALEYISY